MRRGDLAVFILQNVGVRSLQNAWARARESLMRRKTCRVLAKLAAAAAGFDANHFHGLIAQELVEKANRVRSAADTGEKMSGQTRFSAARICSRASRPMTD